MTAIGFNEPLYILPFDHRGSFQTKMFGWPGKLSANETAEIAAAKQVIYDGFKAALHEARQGSSEGGVPIGACLVSAEGKILGQGHNMRIQKGSATLHVGVTLIIQPNSLC